MKKILTIIFLITITFSTSYGEIHNPFYDAQKLRALLNASNKWPDNTVTKNAVSEILSYYCKKDDINQRFFVENPFIKEYSENWSNKSGIAGGMNIGNAFSAIGGLDVTKYANAVADLMIDRAKQELTIAFFDRFQKISNQYPEFQALFPKTADNLKNLLSYNYPTMLPFLQNGFIEDLQQITYHLEGVMELPKYATLLRDLPEVRIAVRSLRLMHDIETGESNAADIIHSFSQFPEWANDEEKSIGLKNMGSAIRLADIFSQSLRNEDDTRVWVSIPDIKKLMNDPVSTKIFMGLLYQEMKNNKITFYLDDGTSKDLTITIDEQSVSISQLQSKIYEFIALSDKLMKTYKEIDDKKIHGEKLTNDDIYNYINLSINTIDFTFNVVKIFDDKIDDKIKVADYIDIARKSNSIYKYVYSGQYALAVNDAIVVIQKVYELANENNDNRKNNADSTKNQIAKKLKTANASDTQNLNLAKVQNSKTISSITANSDLLQKLNKFIKKAQPFITFVGACADAKTSDDVKNALENAILPVGSSAIKKNAAGLGNVSIQSYLGAYYTFSDPVNGTYGTGSWSEKFGVIAPIGVSWTPGFLSWQKAGSLSLFVSIFDIGAIVDYKLKSDSVLNAGGTKNEVKSKDYTIKLQNIIAPGGYLVYGAPGNLPLALGAGAQYGPGLTDIIGGTSKVVNPSWRWNAFLTVDLPFFNLANTSRQKKLKTKK